MLNTKGFAKILCIGTALVILASCSQSGDGVEKAVIHAKSALAYQSQGQYRAAIIEARNAIKFDASVANNLLLASVLMDMGQPAGVITILEPAKDTHADIIGLTLAKAYLSRGKHRSALELLTDMKEPETQALQQKFLAAKLEAFVGTRRYEEATELLVDIRSRQKSSVDTLLSQLQLAVVTEDSEALAVATSSLRENYTDDPKALFTLSKLSIQANQLDEAENLLTQALSFLPTTDVVTPQKIAILSHLSQTLTQQGRFRDALIYQKLLDENNPGSQAAQQRFDEAMAEALAGNLENAETLLSELMAEFPSHMPTKSLLGMVSLQLGDSATASTLFDEVIDPETSSPELIKAAATARLLQNQPEAALALLDEALKDNPNNTQLLATYGLAALRTSSAKTDGEIALQKALAVQPQNVRWRLALAQHYSSQKLPEQANAQVSKALKSNPSNLQVQTFMLRLLIEQKKNSEAIKFTHQLQRNYADIANTWLLSALALASNGDSTSAISALEQAVSLESDHLPSQLMLGKLLLKEARFSEAEAQLRKASTTAPNNILVMKGLMMSLVAQDKADSGIKLLEGIATKPETLVNASAVLAEFYLSKADLAAAKVRIDQVSEDANHTRAFQLAKAKTYQGLAANSRRSGDLNTARQHLLHALTAIPNSIKLLFDLANVEVAAKNMDRARQIIAELNEEPKNGRVRGSLLESSILHQEGKTKEAISLLETEWSRSKNQQVALALYQYAQKMSVAVQATFLDDWIATHKNDARPHVLKAMELQEAGKAESALFHYLEVLKLQAEHTVSLNNAAWLLHEAGQGAKALSFAIRAQQSSPNSPEIMDTVGWIAFKQGKPEGLPFLKKAQALAPNNKEINAHYQAALARQKQGPVP